MDDFMIYKNEYCPKCPVFLLPACNEADTTFWLCICLCVFLWSFEMCIMSQ